MTLYRGQSIEFRSIINELRHLVHSFADGKCQNKRGKGGKNVQRPIVWRKHRVCICPSIYHDIISFRQWWLYFLPESKDEGKKKNHRTRCWRILEASSFDPRKVGRGSMSLHRLRARHLKVECFEPLFLIGLAKLLRQGRDQFISQRACNYLTHGSLGARDISSWNSSFLFFLYEDEPSCCTGVCWTIDLEGSCFD